MNELVMTTRFRWVKSLVRRVKGRFNMIVESALPRRQFEAAYWAGPATLTIVCDDGPKTDLAKIVPLLEDHGVRGVFAITNDLIGQPGYMDGSELRALCSAGHEIASHMHTHWSLDMFSPKVLCESLKKSRLELSLLLGGQPVPSLVFPFGYNSRAIRGEVKDVFACGVCTWRGLNHGAFNRYAIRRIPFGSHTKVGENQLQWYLQLLDQTVALKAWLVIMVHSARDEHDAYQSSCLSALLERARVKGVGIATLSEALADVAVTPINT